GGDAVEGEGLRAGAALGGGDAEAPGGWSRRGRGSQMSNDGRARARSTPAYGSWTASKIEPIVNENGTLPPSGDSSAGVAAGLMRLQKATWEKLLAERARLT